MKLYYLTRTFYPYQKGGGPLMRQGAVKYLQELGWDVEVIMPNYGSNQIKKENNITLIPYNQNQRFASWLERLGIYEDYLDKWVKNAFEYLKDRIKKEYIVFATSGGELGMIKLGSLLKRELGCKFVVNFRDPLDYTIVNGMKLNNKFHISREKQEKKYLKNADLIITSSQTYQKVLQSKSPYLVEKIKNNYFGYVNRFDIQQRKKNNSKLRIAYVGSMTTTQKPEILYEVYKQLKDDSVEIYFIGNTKSYQLLKNINDKNVNFIDFLPHNKFLEFMSQNINIGFVSLANDYLGACVPSKIYEYINLELPMIGALPEGDGKDIINNYNYGIACKYDDINGLVKAIEKFREKDYLYKIKKNIQKDKEKWYMKNKILEVDEMLKGLISGN